MDTRADQQDLTSGARRRAQVAGARVRELDRELRAERALRDAAIVECYEAGVPVAKIGADAQVARSTILGIIAGT